MSRQVALLRGINVGGKHKVPMKDLAALFEAAGFTDVKTYIQSGNVVFFGPSGQADALAARIEERFGFPVPIVLRTAADLARIVRDSPFEDREDAALHVMFLAGDPDPKGVAGLDPNRSAPDVFAVIGREIYLSLPNGVGRSKLTNAWFDSRLKTVSTTRNWRTVLTLLDLASK